jgi:hypothetical protein
MKLLLCCLFLLIVLLILLLVFRKKQSFREPLTQYEEGLIEKVNSDLVEITGRIPFFSLGELHSGQEASVVIRDGSVLNNIVLDTTLKKAPQGPQGPQGPRGDPGSQGNKGPQGLRGPKGYWSGKARN